MGGTTGYDQNQFRHNYPPGMRHYFWTHARNRVLLRAIRRYSDLLPLLEIGCGTGIVTGYLRTAGLDVTGIEIGTPDVDETAREHVITASDALTADPAFRQRFRGIGLFDVIEHIADAPTFLRAVLAAYPNVNRVILTVPADPKLWSNYDDYFGHFRRYTRRSLVEHLKVAGLRPRMVRYFFHGLYAAMWLNIALGRRNTRRVVFQPPVRQPWRGIHAIVAVLLDWEHRLVPGVIPGSSLLAIADRVHEN